MGAAWGHQWWESCSAEQEKQELAGTWRQLDSSLSLVNTLLWVAHRWQFQMPDNRALFLFILQPEKHTGTLLPEDNELDLTVEAIN